MQLPVDTLLLLDGRTVCNNLLRFGEVNFDVQDGNGFNQSIWKVCVVQLQLTIDSLRFVD